MNSTRDDKILKEFGKRLKKYRTTRKLSIRRLSDIADVDFSQIHRIEKGESNPTLTMILTLASALNVTVTELVSDLKI